MNFRINDDLPARIVKINLMCLESNLNSSINLDMPVTVRVVMAHTSTPPRTLLITKTHNLVTITSNRLVQQLDVLPRRVQPSDWRPTDLPPGMPDQDPRVIGCFHCFSLLMGRLWHVKTGIAEESRGFGYFKLT